MKRLLIVFLLISSTWVYATPFCEGFEEGYKMVKGEHAYVPYCPYEPYTPYGSTPFREGLKEGIKRAKRY